MICLKINYMMHYELFLSAILVVVYCAPLPKDSDSTILSYNYTNDGKGGYNYRFETSNGIIREESGTLVDVGLPNEHILVKGSYSYINSDRVLITVYYVADDKGYRIIKPPSVAISVYSDSVSPAVLATLLGK
ncbi:endocuticle structural glycoprotein SgAbd-5-like [Vanessa atalanta]|uniref:endocuticle structural glycoprotein SgAbd-5-like n=1 Tax=Vanessa atalanta TaxID=42275 RepID=UPI001FCCE76B|nr:endocuticle structural glycoprotein SgAbd-5-like [Vanessa atalanta]